MPNGLVAERFVARDLVDKGFLVSSRRHFGGAGDILAVQELYSLGTNQALLVEVKATAAGPFAGFPPLDRSLMRAEGGKYDVEPLLAWVSGRRIFYIPEEDWPK